MSEKPAAIQGTYADLKFVKTRKVAQITVEIAIEEAVRFVELFGAPNPAAEIPVVVFRPTEKAAEPAPEKRERTLAEMAGILCQDPAFWGYVSSCGEYSHGAPGATLYLRKVCGVESRREILPGTPAAEAFQRLRDDFGLWRDYPDQWQQSRRSLGNARTREVV